MKVIFYNVPHSHIKNFEKMSFDEAVKISHDVEHVCRDENLKFSSEFQVIGDDDKVYYKGVFDFGSYDYPNIYHKIKNMVNRIKVDKEHQADKLYLLDQIEALTPEEYKKEEKIDKLLINLDQGRISKLKKWQRKTFYGLGAVGIAGFLMSGLLFFVQKDSYESALADGRSQLEQSKELNEIYEIAILGDDNKMMASLEKMSEKELTENQIQILLFDYISNDKFDKAVELLGNDYTKTESMIMTLPMPMEEMKEKITAFNEVYPTNEARFDLAYMEGDWELMMNIENVTMNVKRSSMKTYALMKLGKIDEAKLELNNNNNKRIAEAITKYEILTAEIITLEDKHNLLSKENKEDEAKTIQEEIEAKKKELQSL